MSRLPQCEIVDKHARVVCYSHLHDPSSSQRSGDTHGPCSIDSQHFLYATGGAAWLDPKLSACRCRSQTRSCNTNDLISFALTCIDDANSACSSSGNAM
jgi:hypothetical protein